MSTGVEAASSTAAGGQLELTTLISSVETAHTPFEMVQRNVAPGPGEIPVIVVVGEDGLVIVAVPLTSDQDPVPIAGVLAAIVKLKVLHIV